MTQSTSAALHIQGPTIRYAHVVREGDACDLRLLEEQAFAFDVTRALWEENRSDDLEHVAETSRRVFSDLDVAVLRVVLNPLDVFSFFTPIPAGLSDRGQRRYVTSQTALVTGARSPNTLNLSLQPVRPAKDDAIEWVHVLALPQAAAERMDALTNSLPVQDVARMTSSEAAAWVVGHAEVSSPFPAETEATYSLAIGQYGTHTEYSLTREGTWHHAHAAQEARSPANRIYYAAGFLNRVGVGAQAVDRLFVYGPEAGTDGPFEAVFDCQPESLNPFEGLRRVPDRFEEQQETGGYVPCIGGALDPPV